MFNQPIPINIASWAIGAIVVGFVSHRLWLSYKQTGNYLSRLFSRFDLILALALATYTFPYYVIDDPMVLIWGYFISDLLLYVAYLIQARILWFIALKDRIKFIWLGLPVVILALVGLVDEFRGATLELSYPLALFRYPKLSLFIQVVLLATIILPAGFVFLAQAVKEIRQKKPIQAFLKSVALGLAYILVGGMVILNNVSNEGGETVGSSFFNALVFLALFVAVLIPTFKAKAAK